MALMSSIRSKCSFTSLRRPEGMFWGLSLKSLGMVTFILCSAAAVHPIFPSSSWKISWYSVSRFKTFSFFSSVQDLRPESSSFSKRTFLLSLMESPVQPALANLWVQSVPTVLFTTTVSGTSFAATILATGVPFFRMI